MTEMINALLLKYKRGTARPGLRASHRTVVVTLTYHHQQIIILGHTGHQLHHGKLWQDTGKKGGWMMLGWVVVKTFPCLCGFGLLTLMTSIL